VADDGLFPAIFARTGRAGTPVYGLLISTTLTTILIATNYTRGLVALFTFILFLATLATLIPYVFCTMAWWLDARAKGRPRRGRTTVALLAFVYAMGAIAGAGSEAVFWGFLLLLAGLPVYVLLKRVPAP
jgi:basic amino acid/polyamine antiporter, APA family